MDDDTSTGAYGFLDDGPLLPTVPVPIPKPAAVAAKRGVRFRSDSSSSDGDKSSSVQIHDRTASGSSAAISIGMPRVSSSGGLSGMLGSQPVIQSTIAMATPNLTHEQLKYKR